MDFCKKCGSRLISKKEGDTLAIICPKCNSKKQILNPKVAPKLAKTIKHDPQHSIAVISKKDQKLRTLPAVKNECPKCVNNLAYVWQVQTRGADESSTQFLRCTKCSYTYREYS